MSKFEIDVSKIKTLIIYTEGEMVLGRNNLDNDTDVIGLNVSLHAGLRKWLRRGTIFFVGAGFGVFIDILVDALC